MNVNNLKDAIVATSNIEYDEAMSRQTLLTCLQALLLTCDGQPGVSPERLGPGEHVWVWRGAGQRRHARLGARPGRAEVVSGVVPADTTRSHCTADCRVHTGRRRRKIVNSSDKGVFDL